MKSIYDVIVIGAGSAGVPVAMALGAEKLKVLVIDCMPSCGQGNNKRAIGGIRATHSDYGKIKVCQRSIEIFSTWEEENGDKIGWQTNGYSYPAFNEQDEKLLKDLMKIQKSYGLDIEWLSPEEYKELVPGINDEELRGSTYSPGDGSASPLLSNNAFYFKSIAYGAEYVFNEEVVKITVEKGRATSVGTDKNTYYCQYVINASGNTAAEIGRLVGINLPVVPYMHEGAITEPVKRFFGPMIVDLRVVPDSMNYYFYQNEEGQVAFCITPNPELEGMDNDSTSVFFPEVAKRMVDLYPRLAHLKIRRSWRGQYPMTPDGFPIVGVCEAIPNFINCVGMCGQGFMLGPGLGELVTKIVTGTLNKDDKKTLKSFDPLRNFEGAEFFK